MSCYVHCIIDNEIDDDFTCMKPVWLLTSTATLLFLAFLDVALIEEVQEENSVR